MSALPPFEPSRSAPSRLDRLHHWGGGAPIVALALLLLFAVGCDSGEKRRPDPPSPAPTPSTPPDVSEPSPVVPLDPPSSVSPALPWLFEASGMSAWVDGPSGVVIDSAGVVWTFDHSHASWLPRDFERGIVRPEELAQKYRGAVAVHRADPRLLERARELARLVAEEPLEMHGAGTLDATESFSAWEWVAGEDGADPFYREHVIDDGARLRRGAAARGLVAWQQLQLGDPYLKRFDPRTAEAEELRELATMLDAQLPSAEGSRASKKASD